MLKQRVLTALFLLPLAMVMIFALPVHWFFIVIAIILLAGSREYVKLAGLSSLKSGHLLLILQTIIFISLYQFRTHWDNWILIALSVSCIAWLVMFSRLTFYRPDQSVNTIYRRISFVTAIASITTAWFAICWLRNQEGGSWLILLLLLIVWAADIGAYFIGRTFGNRKLAPSISPGKTLAGLYGGLIAAPLVALIAMVWMPAPEIQPLQLALLGLLTALVCVGGDLLISMHKRSSGLKDSSNLLPGHGGILDRLDSLLAAAPFFALGLLVTGT